MELKPQLVKNLFPFVQKPTRYLGNEFGSSHDSNSESRHHTVLCYTGSYESGMQNATFEFLYHLLNSKTAGSADRCYAPGQDAAVIFTEQSIPLFANDSRRDLRSFRILAFQIDDPLCFQAMLMMLHLSGIPLKSRDRDINAPLVIAYGKAMSNPEPVADFCDVVVPGSPHSALFTLCNQPYAIQEDQPSRAEFLKSLASEGYYIPANYEPSYSAFEDFEGLRRIKSTTEENAAPLQKATPVSELSFQPLIALSEIGEANSSLDIPYAHPEGQRQLNSRLISGSHSGFIERLHPASRKQLDRLGYEGLFPLFCETSSDSAMLWRLIKETAFAQGKPLRLTTDNALLRTGDLDLSAFSKQLKEHPFSVAVCSASPRLRQMLNINLRDHELVKLVQFLAESGWKRIRLLFTIGLPTERDDDVAAISEMLTACKAKLSSFEGTELAVQVNIFAPLPNTSLQWEQMESKSVLQRRIQSLTIPDGVVADIAHVESARVRGALLRGDRRLGSALEHLISKTPCNPGSKQFSEDWQNAFAETGLDIARFCRSRSLIDPLPWDLLGSSEKSNLKADKLLAAANKLTQENRDQVSLGASIGRERFQELLSDQYRQSMISETAQQKSAGTTPKISYGRRGKKRQNSQAIIKRRLRVRYAKSGFMRFLSHSDIIRVFELATLSAKIPLVYSQSLRPTPKIAYGSPLMTGIASVAEYLDMEIHIGQEADIQNHLNSYLPEGIEILQYQGIYAKVTALAAVINRATYDILLTGGEIPNTWIADWMATENIPIKRLYKDGPRELNVRPFVSSMEQKEDRLSITIDAHEGRMVKITEVLESLLAPKNLDYRAFFIQRTGQFAIKDNSQYTPLEILP